MGGKSSAPAAPDYTAAAQAQGQANLTSAQQGAVLSNPNVTSPYGNQTVNYTTVPNPNGTGDPYMQPNVTQTLTPAAQQTLESQQAVQQGLSGLAQQGIGTAQSALQNPFSYSGQIQTAMPNAGAVNQGPSADQYGSASGGPSAGQYGLASGNLNTSGVAAMPVNAGTTGQQAIMQRLQPQIQQGDTAYSAQLANQGIAYGSQAYDNAMRVHNQSNNDLLSQAALQGIGLDMSANQQGYNQALQSGQFGNQAVAQNFGQGQAAAQLGNQAIAQNYGQGLSSAQMQNQAQNQTYNQGLQSAQFGNTAEQQQLQQALALRNQPLNEISGLMSGSQIQNPQFQAYQGQSVNAAPLFNAAQQQYNSGLQNYSAQNAAQNSFNSGLFQLGSAGLGAYALMAS